MNVELESILRKKGADIVRFADISALPPAITQGFPRAILFCMALPKKFVMDIHAGLPVERDEFVEKERLCDGLADWLADDLRRKGYRAYSQSKENNLRNGNYNDKTRTSLLPHKTIARLAGLGFIGKNNLLVTREYGCALTMCMVLTDAPIPAVNMPLMVPKCGECTVCRDVCPAGAIHGESWSLEGGREKVVDVFKCVCPLRCMVNCPWTLNYAMAE